MNNLVHCRAGRVSIMSLILFFGFIGLWVFLLHLDDLKTIEDYHQKSNNTRMPIFILLNTATVASTSLQFGRPHSVFVITVIGLFIMLYVSKSYSGLFEWMDKTLYIISSLFYIDIKYLRTNNQRKKLNIFIVILIIFFSLFLSFYYLYSSSH